MPKFDVLMIKSFRYFVGGVEADHPSQVYKMKGLAKDEFLKLEQPEKYGRLTGKETEIIEVEVMNDE